MPKDPTGLEPTCLALVLCEYAHRDFMTGRYSLLGTIDTISSRSFPGESPVMHAYVALTDGRGGQRITVRIIDSEEEFEPIFDVSSPIKFKDPWQIVEDSFVIHPILFASAGTYRLQLLVNNAIIAERSLKISQEPDDE